MLILLVRQPDGAERRLSFPKSEISLGRDSTNDVSLADGSVSKLHANITRTLRGVVITDLGSTNGTYVNGTQISGARALYDSDEIQIGAFVLWIDPETLSIPTTAPAVTIPPVAMEPPARKAQSKEPPVAVTHAPSVTMPVVKTATAVAAVAPEKKKKAAPAAAAAPPATPDKGRTAQASIAALIERLRGAMNLDAYTKEVAPTQDLFKKFDEVLDAQVEAMVGERELEDSLKGVVRDATRREFLEYGPLGPWLDEPNISLIQALRYDQIELTTGGRSVRAELVFSSGAAFLRALHRLVKGQSNRELTKGELIVERRLQHGARLAALVPPLAANLCLTIRKRRAFVSTMPSLVAAKTLSDGMAAFLTRCMRNGVNLFVCGNDDRHVLEVTAALASATPASDRATILHAGDEVRVEGRRFQSVGLPTAAADEEQAIRVAIQLGHEHNFVTSMKASSSASAVVAMASGAKGFVVVLRTRTVQNGLMLVAGELILARPGLRFEEASLLVSQSFEIGVEVSSLPDARAVVSRIVEIERSPAGLAARDLFVLTRTPEGQELGFAQTGVSSRVIFD